MRGACLITAKRNHSSGEGATLRSSIAGLPSSSLGTFTRSLISSNLSRMASGIGRTTKQGCRSSHIASNASLISSSDSESDCPPQLISVLMFSALRISAAADSFIEPENPSLLSKASVKIPHFS